MTDLSTYDLYLRALAAFYPIPKERVFGAPETPETTRRKAGDLARLALEMGENDPRILANAAVVVAGLGEDIVAMMGLFLT